MNLIKSKSSICILFLCFIISSCATNKSPYRSEDDTHFYTSDLKTTVDGVQNVVQQSGMDIVSTSSESNKSFQMTIVLNAYGVSQSDRVQLYNASVAIERINDELTRVHIRDRRKTPATVASTDVKDYGSDLFRKIDEKLPVYKPETSPK